MKRFTLSSPLNMFTACNSVFFFVGIAGFFLQNITLTAISVLIISLLFLLYQALQPDAIPEDSEVIEEFTESEEDLGKIQLALKVQELTETNEQLSNELSKLQDAFEREQDKVSSATHLYSCPLTASIPLDINSLLQSYIQEKNSVLKGRNIHLFYQPSNDEIRINLSTVALHIVLDNLFDNILKFTPFDGSLYIRLAVENTKQMLLIFKNTCKPITDTDVDKIFDLNYQSANHLSGTGLGLAQAKAIICDFGGKIWAKISGEDAFTIYLELPLYHYDQKIISADTKGKNDEE